MTWSRPFWRRFWLALAAVIAGNAIYFAIQRILPPAGVMIRSAWTWDFCWISGFAW